MLSNKPLLECPVHCSEDGDDNPEVSFHFQTSSSLPPTSSFSIAIEYVNFIVLQRITLVPGFLELSPALSKSS